MNDEPANTGETLAKQPNGRNMPPKEHQFKKGFDPKRNLKGIPRDAVAMRAHMRKIAAELIGGDESAMTRLDACLRQLWTSRNPAHNKLALQVLDPKILAESVNVNVKGDLEIGIKQIDYRNGISIPATRSSDDSSESS